MKIYIKYMVSTRCKMMVREVLKKLGLHIIIVDLGEAELMESLSSEQRDLKAIELGNADHLSINLKKLQDFLPFILEN